MNHPTNGRVLLLLAGISLAAVVWVGRINWVGVAAAQAPRNAAEQRPVVIFDKAPVRVIEDDNPSFNAIAMDGDGNEVFISNNNKASTPSILVYPAEFKTTDRVMEPKRRIGGPTARLGDICGLALSPQNKEIYTVQGEETEMKVFPIGGNGDMAASRSLTVAHGSADVFLDSKHDELFISTEHINKITVYSRAAQGSEKPLRFIQGPHTEIADPHSIFVDTDTDEMFVTNYGNWRATNTDDDVESRATDREEAALPLADSTGKFVPPSIAVYSRTAQGDAPPLRVIQGSHTQLNLPLGVARDPLSGQIMVANSGGDAVLFFDGHASGDVAPVRVLKGTATNLKAPTGVLVDTKRNELWVTSWENHTTNVFPRMAEGNVTPLRYIRSAPKDSPPATFGTPGAVAWDPKRKEILVPN
jgi:DNA-binding beta-propeller fold protein YncE